MDDPPRETELVALGHPGSDAYAGLESFPNPGVSKVELTSDELAAVCPVTGQPDLYIATIEYQPDTRCLESKSLKLYLNEFRDQGVFCEALAVKIRDDVAEASRFRRSGCARDAPPEGPRRHHRHRHLVAALPWCGWPHHKKQAGSTALRTAPAETDGDVFVLVFERGCNVSRRGTLAVVCLATAMLMLDIAVVNTALPNIASSLDAGITGIQWVVDAYTVALAAIVLTCGSIADRFGRRRLFSIRARPLHRLVALVRHGDQHRHARHLPRGARASAERSSSPPRSRYSRTRSPSGRSGRRRSRSTARRSAPRSRSVPPSAARSPPTSAGAGSST
jgi:hypothetical protein